MDFIRHGRIKPMPAIKSWNGLTVEFVDGTKKDFDIVCAATGYWTTFPFFDEGLINFKDLAQIPLYKKMMHEKHKNLYFIGLFQPIGCIWPLADYQAKLACLEILGKYQRPKDMKSAINHELNNRHFDFGPGQRHAMEVDFHTFRDELKKELKRAGINIGNPPVGNAKRYKDFSKVH
jgi:hypothetical protein